MKVSVIVPVYNAERFIRKCLDGLVAQDYPREDLEIIIVDNGSEDRTPDIISEYKDIKLLFEREIQSSYAARNRGLEYAKGDILAFTDADCVPEPSWVSEGARCFDETGADMIGGRVRFIYSKRQTAAELYDSFINMQNHQCIPERGVAKTANFFAKRSVFETIGTFPSEVKSGGDLIFTGKATNAGLRLVYCHNAVVWHPSRRFLELARKLFRTGYGKASIRVAKGEKVGPLRAFGGFLIQFFRPTNPTYFADRIRQEGIKAGWFKTARVSFVMYLAIIIARLGEFFGTLAYGKEDK